MPRAIRFCWPMVALFCLSSHAHADSDIDRATQNVLSANYTLGALLTNGEAVRFGFWDFNPNDVFELDNDEFGNTDSAQLRQSIATASLPFNWTYPFRDTDDQILLSAHLAYISQSQDVKLVVSDESGTDKLEETLLFAGVGAGFRHHIGDRTDVTVGSSLSWVRYRNDTNYRTEASREVQSELDGLLTNIKVDAVLAEPRLQVTHTLPMLGARWHFFSDYHYLFGTTINTDRNAHEAKPEAWYWFNGFKIRDPLFSRWLPGQNIWFRLARVDVGGDIGDQLGNDHYYEAGLAWLLRTGSRVPFLDNIGIGINFNYGSVLRGGSLVLMLNEDWF
ncbi:MULTISPECIES: Solitary outer membrane autotransporter beta-barrel domain [Marinobacter]|uniref:Solitary outer membrane autotransporter beta-barrel domain n=1 Tax=Marinobacter TaxID=2742 RepID=UPI000DAB81B2|nr:MULTISPECIES: Solitary outer membrane autotransporter beta-barrel domain [Marinobacter]